MTKPQQEKSSTKEYSLTPDETSNIDSRQSIIKQYQYLIHVINKDIEAYTNFVVCKRCGVPEGVKYQITPDNKKLIYDPAKTE